MILVIGGRCQGKTEYAARTFGIPKEAFADGETCTKEELLSAKGVRRFHEYIRRVLLEEGEEEASLTARTLIRENPEAVIISDELGYGVVPMDKFERLYREKTGRICCELAAFAGRVDRVVCGLGMVIKDEVKNDGTKG